MKAQDWIALVVVVGGLTLLGLGKNGLIGGLLVAVVAYYFGEGAVRKLINNKNVTKKKK